MKFLSSVNKSIFAGGLLVWLSAFTVYYLTVAPTLSFWDSGEFIASAHILGIPHPPGTPLYVLLGRLFAVLPLAADPAVRINMLSVIPSAFTALFVYLSAQSILSSLSKKIESSINNIFIIGGSVCAGWWAAFSLTNWNNSVESEVYGLSMMLFAAIFYLSIQYLKTEDSNQAGKLLLLIMFTAFAGIGVHMTTFMIIPAVALIFILKPKTDPKIWFSFGAIFLFLLYLIFAFSSLPSEIPFYFPVLLVFIVYLFYIFSFNTIVKDYIYLGLAFVINLIPVIGWVVTKIGGEGPNEILNIIGWVGAASVFIVGCLYALKYKKQNENIHYLVIASYALITTLMTGSLYVVHGYDAYLPFLIVTILILLGTFCLFRQHLRWSYLIAIGLSSLVVIGLREFGVGVLVAAVLIIILGLKFNDADWKNGLMILMVAIIGFSIHLYIPIKSSTHPMINENNPSSSIRTTVDFIERKQYGSMSMTKRMFSRRADWFNQFGEYRHMGFWSYFNKQYGVNDKSFVILFIVGLFGLWEVLRRRTQLGIPLLMVLVLSTIGLILYMNFADGTRQSPITGQDYLEVRDRDYFFTPGFIMFGMVLGLGLTFIMQYIYKAVEHKSAILKQITTVASIVLFLSPMAALANNYYQSDRSDNFMAYDYAWNILSSAEENAVIFTVGDNDTFPLWCLQETYGVRKDVAIVNLSLANTKWYIKQVKSNLGVKLSWFESDIDSLKIYRDQNGKLYRLADQLVSDIIRVNRNVRPVNFAITVPSSSRQYYRNNIDTLLSLQGMAFKINESGQGIKVEIESGLDLYYNKFKFRGINDDNVYKNETALRLSRNYARTAMLICDSLLELGEMEQAKELISFVYEKLPHSTEAYEYLGTLYAEMGLLDDLEQLIKTSSIGNSDKLNLFMARLSIQKQDLQRAEITYWKILNNNHDYRPAFEDLMRLYYELGQAEQFKKLLMFWLTEHPDDDRVDKLLKAADQQFKFRDTLSGNSDENTGS